ncbi:histidine kinase [Magnetococcus marinus MC-1]|uniref:histidine kinase n=1 Tax=Magnetococcus marinus (strain ATCC BAA-1437 / JCM 17883 / MC-1) TaxID=156889 RepID=A0L755_MAGMM|nr:HAMP domain-containing sensor histidine kinase [Magnetococcus marinus]ABK43798.1 histidine kinase [Magnetococcus marinus MC-1]
MMDTIKPETGLDGLLQAFCSSNWPTVRDAVDQGGGLLRYAAMEPFVHARLGEQMFSLARHEKWEVRKALAHAILFLRHETFDRIIAVLEEDDNAWVKSAAKRTMDRRQEISKTDLLKDEHGDLMLEWLSDLEEKHGAHARGAAKRVAEKLQNQFVREFNHEMVKVISPMDVSLTLLKTALEQKRLNRALIQKHTTMAKERLEFMMAILNSFRTLTQTTELEFQNENLISVVDEAIHLIRDRKPENSALHVELSVPKSIMLDINRHLLLQALSNILQNSIDACIACDRAPAIKVHATVVNRSRVMLSITDQGTGMSEQDVRSAFRLFATTKPDGTGFGLTIAKKIIESDHAGLIQLSSQKGKGTTVTISLPVKQEDLKW